MTDKPMTYLPPVKLGSFILTVVVFVLLVLLGLQQDWSWLTWGAALMVLLVSGVALYDYLGYRRVLRWHDRVSYQLAQGVLLPEAEQPNYMEAGEFTYFSREAHWLQDKGDDSYWAQANAKWSADYKPRWVIAKGVVMLTNQRIIFTGDGQRLDMAWAEVASIHAQESVVRLNYRQTTIDFGFFAAQEAVIFDTMSVYLQSQSSIDVATETDVSTTENPPVYQGA